MNLIKNMKIDLQRAFCGKLFIIGLLCSLVVFYLNISWDNMLAATVIYLVSGLPWGSHVQLIFVCGAITYATAYLSDWNHGYIRLLVVRGDLRNYLRSKVLVTAFSGFVTIWLGKMLFALSLRAVFPMMNEMSVEEVGIDILLNVNSWLYLLADAVLYALAGAGFAVIALLVSSLMHNMFVTITSPLVVFFMITSLQQIFDVPQAIELNGLLMGYIEAFANSWLVTLLYISLVWVVVIVLVGKLFIWHAGRRFYLG